MTDIDRLRARVEVLEEENRQLREALAPSSAMQVTWGLSPSQNRMFAALYTREVVSTAALAMCCIGPTDGERSPNTVAMQVSRLRKRVAPFGYEIEGRAGHGYRMRRVDQVADVCVAALRSVGREMRAVSQ